MASFAEMDRKILEALREFLGREDIEGADVLEWRTDSFAPESDGEAVVGLDLAFGYVYACVPKRFVAGGGGPDA